MGEYCEIHQWGQKSMHGGLSFLWEEGLENSRTQRGIKATRIDSC